MGVGGELQQGVKRNNLTTTRRRRKIARDSVETGPYDRRGISCDQRVTSLAVASLDAWKCEPGVQLDNATKDKPNEWLQSTGTLLV